MTQHLTPQQLESFRERLEMERAASEAAMVRSADDLRPIEASGSSIGRVTRIDAIQMQAMSQLSRSQLELRVQMIQNALAAVAEGTYGTCRGCNGPIALRRLEAIPEAPFCIACQESFE